MEDLIKDLLHIGFKQSKDNPNRFHREDGEYFINEGGGIFSLLNPGEDRSESYRLFDERVKGEIKLLHKTFQ